MSFNSGPSLERIIADIVALHNSQLPRLLAYLQSLWGSADTPETLKSGAFSFSFFSLFCLTRNFHSTPVVSAPRFIICAL